MVIKTKQELGIPTFNKTLQVLKLKKTCSVKGCTCDAEAIVVFADQHISKFTLCKAHLQHGIDSKEGWNYELNLLDCITSNAKNGDKVHYIPGIGETENGIIKEMCKDGKHAFIVYKCNDDWDNFVNYTGVQTCMKNLFPGWVK